MLSHQPMFVGSSGAMPATWCEAFSAWQTSTALLRSAFSCAVGLDRQLIAVHRRPARQCERRVEAERLRCHDTDGTRLQHGKKKPERRGGRLGFVAARLLDLFSGFRRNPSRARKRVGKSAQERKVEVRQSGVKLALPPARLPGESVMSCTVYGTAASGNCHKVRMALDILGEPYEWREIDILKGESRTPEFLAMNPTGKVPVLVIDGTDVPARVQRDPLVPRRGHASWCRATASRAPACCSGCSSSSTATNRRSRSRASSAAS